MILVKTDIHYYVEINQQFMAFQQYQYLVSIIIIIITIYFNYLKIIFFIA